MSMFYNIVKEYAENFVRQQPDAVRDGFIFCAILTKKHDVFTGVTKKSFRNGVLESVSAENIAVNAMLNAKQTVARQMISVSLINFSVAEPDKDGVAALVNADSENKTCEIYINKNDSVSAAELIGIAEKTETLENGNFDSQFTQTSTDETPFGKSGNNSGSTVSKSADYVTLADLGAPADFSDGVDIDVDNPFYEPAAADTKEVVTIATIADTPDGSAPENSAPPKKQAPAISKEELLKQAKKKKKIAKNIFSSKRK